MKTLYGINNIQAYSTDDIDELNQFLLEYDGNIIEIRHTDKNFLVIYKYRD